MTRKKKSDIETLDLFQSDNAFSNAVEGMRALDSNIVYLSDFIINRREFENTCDRNTILHSFINHAKQFDW